MSVVLSGKDELSTKLTLVRQKFDKIVESSAPLNRKISEIKKQMLELARTGQAGTPLWDRMAAQARAYREELARVEAATRAIRAPELDGGASSGLLSSLSALKGDMSSIAGIAGSAGLGSLGGVLSGLVSPAGAAAMAVGGLAKVFVDAAKAAADFEDHLADLQALTGLDDEGMKKLGDGALDMSGRFQSSAGEIVDAMKLIGSQAPELLKVPDALMEVTDAANVLSEAARIEVTDAAKAITGTMNQMGASSSEAADIINTFAAASQQGSADVAYLNTVFEKAGTNAAGAKMNFVELAAATETIAPKFSSADVAGTNLNGLLLKLSVQANDKFKPAVVGMSQALDNLAAAQLNDAEMQKMVGESGVVVLKTLIDGREQYKKYTESLKGTNTAYEQMEINSNTFVGQMKRLQNNWNTFLIKLGETGYMKNVVNFLSKIMEAAQEMLGVVMQVMGAFEEAFGGAGTSVSDFTTGPLMFLVDILKSIGEVVEVAVRLAGKAFGWIKGVVSGCADWVRDRWNELKSTLNDTSWGRFIVEAFKSILDMAAKAIGTLKKLWNDLKVWLGIETEEQQRQKALGSLIGGKMAGKTSEVKDAAETAAAAPPAPAPSGGRHGAASHAAKSVDYTKVADDGTLSMAQNKLRAYQQQLEKVATTDKDAIKSVNKEIGKWQDEVQKRKWLLHPELAMEEGSWAALDKQIKDIEEKRKILLQTKADPKDLAEIDRQLTDIQVKKAEEGRRLGLEPATGSITYLEGQVKAAEKALADLLKTDAEVSAVAAAQAAVKKAQDTLAGKRVTLGLDIVPTIQKKEGKDLLPKDAVDKMESQQNGRAMADDVVKALNLGAISGEEAQQLIDSINKQLQDLGLEPLELKFDGDTWVLTDAAEKAKQVKAQLDELGGSVTAGAQKWASFNTVLADQNVPAMQKAAAGAVMLGEDLKALGAEGAVAKAGAVLAAVGQLVLGFASASVTAHALGPFGWLAFMGAGLAALSTVISTVKGFADGGIIGGGTFHGDAIVARVNAGEMILNQRQQANLFRMLDSDRAASGINPAKVTFVLQGDKLVGCVDNYKAKMGLA